MAIRKYKPTTPGRRGSSVADFVEITRSDAREVAGSSAAQEGRPQQRRPDHDAPPGRRAQARLPRHRLPSRTTRTAFPRRSRTSSTTPTARRASRSCTTPTARSATSSRPNKLKQGDSVEAGAARRHQARQQPAAAQHPRRYRDPRRSSSVPVAAPRSPARPAPRSSWSPRTAPYGAAAHAVRRNPQRRRALPRDRRRGRQRRAVEHQLGQGRPHALEGQAPDRPRCRHEPGRPPARWWRGQDVRRTSPGEPVGQARGPHPPQEQGQRQAHRPPPQAPARRSAKEPQTCHAV